MTQMSVKTDQLPRGIREGFPGQRMVVLPRPVVRAALAGPLAMDAVPTDIGYFPDAAWHDVRRPAGTPQLIVILCLRGKGWARIGEEAEAEILPGHVLVIPPNRPHGYGAGGSKAWTIYWIHIAGRQAGRAYEHLSERGASNHFFAGEDPETLSLFERILELLTRSYSQENLFPASMAAAHLLGTLIGLRRRQPEAASSRERIERTIAFVRSRLGAKIDVPQLARLANFSTSHFAMVFRKQTGYAVLDYFTRLRMQRAAELLDTTSDPVKRIAAAVGYEDPLYFSRAFRKVHDLSPAQYRAIMKG
ncbi:MAG TPA: helix-turn-helix domain-containing protein [Phycisphaerae bacterium]|nr:helix-turn-helix domain-containing protein [Phycisphaerae bacterium]